MILKMFLKNKTYFSFDCFSSLKISSNFSLGQPKTCILFMSICAWLLFLMMYAKLRISESHTQIKVITNLTVNHNKDIRKLLNGSTEQNTVNSTPIHMDFHNNIRLAEGKDVGLVIPTFESSSIKASIEQKSNTSKSDVNKQDHLVLHQPFKSRKTNKPGTGGKTFFIVSWVDDFYDIFNNQRFKECPKHKKQCEMVTKFQYLTDKKYMGRHPDVYLFR